MKRTIEKGLQSSIKTLKETKKNKDIQCKDNS